MIQKQMEMTHGYGTKTDEHYSNEKTMKSWVSRGVRFTKVRTVFFSVRDSSTVTINLNMLYSSQYITVYPPVILQFLFWPRAYWQVRRKIKSSVCASPVCLLLRNISFVLAQVTFVLQEHLWILSIVLSLHIVTSLRLPSPYTSPY